MVCPPGLKFESVLIISKFQPQTYNVCTDATGRHRAGRYTAFSIWIHLPSRRQYKNNVINQQGSMNASSVSTQKETKLKPGRQKCEFCFLEIFVSGVMTKGGISPKCSPDFFILNMRVHMSFIRWLSSVLQWIQ